jgi:hypothetical protein
MPSATPFIGLPKNIFVAAAKPAPYLAAAGPPPRILFQSFLL